MKAYEECPFNQLPVKQVKGTWYDMFQKGNCGYENLKGELGPGNEYIVAMSNEMYNKGYGCGQCFNFTNPAKNVSLVVMGTDSCTDPVCQEGKHFDFSVPAFEVLGYKDQSGLLFDLTYTKVPCQVYGNVKIMIKDGSHENYVAFLIFNSKFVIKMVSIKLSNSDQFIDMERTEYNYWPFYQSNTGSFELRIESITGEYIYMEIPNVESRKIYETSSQFSQSGCTGNEFDPYAPYKIVNSSLRLLPSITYILLLITILFSIIFNFFSRSN